ncbi:MAG: PEP-CTERM sorting domain-containing protein [Planctomycetia bacterium]|nr:PEP-CTERM sorting domain-containing protein [Planctomycetia bacterium]
MRPCLLTVAALVLSAFVASPASAETVLSQWNANGGITGGPSYGGATAGINVATGTIAGYGQSVPSTPLSSILANGAATDAGTVVTGTTYNRSFTVNPPLLTAANSSVGMQFIASTAGMTAGQAVQLSWSQTVGFRSSRYWQILVSKTGTGGTYSAPSGGVGSSVSQFVNGLTSGTAAISGTATANVSSTGVIDFRTLNGNWLSQGVTTTGTLTAPLAAGFVDNITYTLPTGQGYENNANFAFAIVGLWDPNGTYASGTTGLLSSYAGTDSTDLTNGYNRSLGSGGSMRLDLVTISAVPEPGTVALAGVGLAFGAWAIVRRRVHRAGANVAGGGE